MTFRVLVGLTACAVLAALLTSSGCRKFKQKNDEPPEERGSIMRDAGMSGPTDQRYGSQGKVEIERPTGPGTEGSAASGQQARVTRTYKNCRKSKPVLKNDPKTAEGTLRMVFEALLIEDDDQSFDAFYALIDPEFKNARDARQYWFKQARKYDPKKKLRPFLRLVYSDKDPSFDVCETRKEGEEGFRIFVGKSPPVGSNPPFVLHKVEDKWLIKNFTAF